MIKNINSQADYYEITTCDTVEKDPIYAINRFRQEGLIKYEGDQKCYEYR